MRDVSGFAHPRPVGLTGRCPWEPSAAWTLFPAAHGRTTGDGLYGLCRRERRRPVACLSQLGDHVRSSNELSPHRKHRSAACPPTSQHKGRRADPPPRIPEFPAEPTPEPTNCWLCRPSRCPVSGARSSASRAPSASLTRWRYAPPLTRSTSGPRTHLAATEGLARRGRWTSLGAEAKHPQHPTSRTRAPVRKVITGRQQSIELWP